MQEYSQTSWHQIFVVALSESLCHLIVIIHLSYLMCIVEYGVTH
jgi:hypothetical protein